MPSVVGLWEQRELGARRRVDELRLARNLARAGSPVTCLPAWPGIRHSWVPSLFSPGLLITLAQSQHSRPRL